MDKEIDDGGPACPVNIMDFQPSTGDQVVRDQYFGISVRQWLAAHAPYPEIDGMTGQSAAEAAAFLGLAEGEYDYTKHYFEATAKARYQWADAMIAAGKVKA